MRSIRDIEKRTLGYFFEDGLWDLGFGAFMLLLTVYFWLVGSLDLRDALSLIIPLGQIIVILGGIWLTSKLVRKLKEHITYPRTGYLQYRRKSSTKLQKIVTGILSGVLAGGLVGLSVSLPAMQNRLPAVIGFIFTLICAYLGFRFGQARFHLVGITTLALGITVSLLPASFAPQEALFFGGFGMIWIVSGALTLAAYLRRTQPAEATIPQADHHAQ